MDCGWLVVSQIVVDECAAGDTVAASERLELIAGIPVLAVSTEAKQLADCLILGDGVPASEPRDALHISIAAAAQQWTGIFNPRPVNQENLLAIYEQAL